MKANTTVIEQVPGGVTREGFLIGDGGTVCVEGFGGLR